MRPAEKMRRKKIQAAGLNHAYFNLEIELRYATLIVPDKMHNKIEKSNSRDWLKTYEDKYI